MTSRAWSLGVKRTASLIRPASAPSHLRSHQRYGLLDVAKTWGTHPSAMYVESGSLISLYIYLYLYLYV